MSDDGQIVEGENLWGHDEDENDGWEEEEMTDDPVVNPDDDEVLDNRPVKIYNIEMVQTV